MRAGTGYGRMAAGAVGVALMGIGAVLAVGTGDVVGVALWLAGAIVAHDGLIAPVVLGVGLLLGLLLGGPRGEPLRGPLGGPRLRAYGAVRGALIVAGCLTLVALPVLLRPGAPANSSVLPLNYVRGWLIALAAVAVATGVLVGVRALLRHRRDG
ncbi:hypothetical protein [Streptomyces sp. NPDC048442]|uniref:hypothetical protein n=1 Tax=Streptomyces sp. NPDC048442 TaxID=3154823 RepID=UPI0034280C73